MIVSNAARLLFWHNGLLASYYRIAPATTVSLVLAYALARVLHVAAFFLPLKILLLVTSDGVPSYFRAFIAPDDKNIWIAGLVVAVVAAYVVSQLLASATTSIARAGATNVDRLRSGHPTTTPSDDLVAGYGKVCESYGDLLFCAVAFSVGLYFNPVLFLGFVAVLVIEAAVCGVVLRRYLATQADVAEIVYEKWPKTASIFSSVNFLLGFTILLLQFLYARPVNVLIGILSIFLLRQMLAALTRYSIHGSWLWQHKDELSIQIVRTAPRRHKLPKTLSVLQAYLDPPHYRKDLERRLAGAGLPPVVDVSSLLLDSRTPDCALVQSVVRFGTGEPERLYLDRIYTLQGGSEALRQEDLCLYHVPVLVEPLAPVISTEVRETLSSRLCEVSFHPPASVDIREVMEAACRRLWLVRPPDELRNIWNARHSPLDARLAKAPLQLLRAAAASPAQRQAVGDLITSVPFLRRQLQRTPVYVANSRLARPSTAIGPDGRPVILDWTQWRIEPVGIGLLSVPAPDIFAHEMADSIRRQYPGEKIVSADLLFMVAHCADLLMRLDRLQLAAALSAAEALLQRVRALQARSQHAVAAS